MIFLVVSFGFAADFLFAAINFPLWFLHVCKYFAVFLFISVSLVSLICVYLLFIALSIVVAGLLFQGFCAVFSCIDVALFCLFS